MTVWYRRLVWFATGLALFVVVLGAYVRLSDAGLGCPDWPGCYGSLLPTEIDNELAEANGRSGRLRPARHGARWCIAMSPRHSVSQSY